MSALVMQLRRHTNPAVLTASGCIVVLLIAGSFYSANFLSPNYLLQQLQVASFLGVIATGAMVVILLGHIDLSVPWVVTLGGMMATAAAGWWGEVGAALAIPFGVACGAAVGLVNGVGVAYLRVPSMIFTLGMNAVVQGLVVVYTGGFAPQDRATEAMHDLATERAVLGIPNALLLWAVMAVLMIFMLTRTTLGRKIYAIGNREKAAYLSGVDTRRGDADLLRDLRRGVGAGGRAAGGLRHQGLSGDGRCLSAAGHRGGRARRHQYSGRPGHLCGNDRRHDPDHAAAIHPVGHAD